MAQMVKFSQRNLWQAIHGKSVNILFLTLWEGRKFGTLHKVAFLERYDSLIMDSKTLTQPMDWYWLNLKCQAALDFQRRVSKGH